MSKEDLIELQGVVTEVLAGGNYKVKCGENHEVLARLNGCLLYTSPSPRDRTRSRMPSSA